MTVAPSKIGLGGGCHWCTEGVFESLLGVTCVNQGWIASNGENSDYSEAVEVYFDPAVISLADLIEIHLHTHMQADQTILCAANTVPPYIPMIIVNLSRPPTY
jgi:peptide methionine sulfoxide reductase MsrA